jgi:sulfite dehydrogenase (cytochrome) subunit B
MRYVLAGLIATLFFAHARAQENIALKDAAGRQTVESYCAACHSLDYLRVNTPVLDRNGWKAEVGKMIKAFGAPIEPADAGTIVDYLAKNYGTGE